MLNYCNIFGQQSQWHHMTSSHNILLPPDRVECQCDSNQVVFEKQNVNKVPSFEVIKIKCAIEKGIIFIDHQFTKIEIPKITFVKCKVQSAKVPIPGTGETTCELYSYIPGTKTCTKTCNSSFRDFKR